MGFKGPNTILASKSHAYPGHASIEAGITTSMLGK
jgi:hypothetical protein